MKSPHAAGRRFFLSFLCFLFYNFHNLVIIGLNQPKSIQNGVKLSFLSAALDPQEMVQRYWSYEGFMSIFGFGLINWMCGFIEF